ncbi:hypothetical protein HPB48_006641 [Haemaphysalis longicornis]|uniref:Uncharacterized protein n=1 Tax=Haemaphysalis longicornis TaxID=44386 RepID=A0A9J6GU41_HAELO|nr:hypothetical protein HPB48_006641 [Haemaphysalis longicornis]
MEPSPPSGEHAAATQALASLVVAASKTITGYDPVSIQVICMDTAQHEDCPPSEEGYLEEHNSQMARQTQFESSQGQRRSWSTTDGGSLGSSSTRGSSKPQWRSNHTLHTGLDEHIVVLKPSTTPDLKATFASGQEGSALDNLLCECGKPATRRLLRLCHGDSRRPPAPLLGTSQSPGEVCKGVIKIDPNNTSASLKPKLRWKNGEILTVKRRGSCNVAVVIFKEKFIPCQIYYNDHGIQGGYLPETKTATLRPMRLRGGYLSRGPCRTQMHSLLPHL